MTGVTILILRSIIVLQAAFTTKASLKVAVREGPIVRESESFQVLGHGLHSDALTTTWAYLQFPATRVGLECSPERSNEACGHSLVCYKRLCMHCTSDRQCGRNSFCQKEMTGKNMCVKEHVHVWNEVGKDPYELLCSILIFISSVLAAAAGLGGGGVFVPLLILFSGLAPSDAVPLSQVMILCGSLVNLTVFVGQRHPEHENQAKIDYNCVALFQPLLVAGVTLGVLINKMSPNWLIIFLLLVTLVIALWRSSLKAIAQYRKESRQVQSSQAESDERAARSESSLNNFFWLTNINFRPINAVVLTWIGILLASLHQLNVCSVSYALYLGGVILAMVLITFLVSRYVINQPMESDPYDDPMSPQRTHRTQSEAEASGDIPSQREPMSPKPPTQSGGWQGSGTWLYASISFCAGLLGGLLGLGGGIILGPILLELGLHTEAVQATTALFVFISSSIATFQFALLSAEVYIWHYTLWYAAITTVATIFGQWACSTYVRKHGKYSMINFAMVAVIGFSALALGFVGGLQVQEDYDAGLQMGFSSERLCNSKGLGIVAADSMVVPDDARVRPVLDEPWGQGLLFLARYF